MNGEKKINVLVRRRLRQLRLAKNLKIRQIAESAGIPVSSYACMESGHYNINLDNLFRVLGALNADIASVWPSESEGSHCLEQPAYRERLQDFRLGEIITLSAAEGGALFKVKGSECSVVLEQGLSDFLLDRICFYLEDGRTYDQGLWFSRQTDDLCLSLFLKAQDAPSYARKLISHYLTIWSAMYANS